MSPSTVVLSPLRTAQHISIQLPSACTFCVSGCSLEVKGPLLPSPLASPFLPHRHFWHNSLASGQETVWAQVQAGKGKAQPKATVAASKTCMHLPFILRPPQNFNLYTNSTLLCQRYSIGEKSLPIGWDPQRDADLRSCVHGEQASSCHQATSPQKIRPPKEKLTTFHELQYPQGFLVHCSRVAS